MNLHPDQNLNCLLVYPKFSLFSFWNTIEAIKYSGAKATTPPLGLLTVAAIMPQNWNFRLMDLNAYDFNEDDWAWADMICVSGMLPQQSGVVDIIKRAKKDGIYVCAGGPDPTSQPEVYADADALVLNEGEITIPLWIESWKKGKAKGVFSCEDKPDVSMTPVPRYDLININDYYYMGVQYARGCPFNCEFCDIIELFGRKPRHKSPEQFLTELEAIHATGFRGYIEIVDDNFIGNKRNVKRELLPALIEWQNKMKRPFYFGTEASMNMSDDDALLAQMRDAEFKWVFVGIETPDPDLLMMTQKSHNTMRPITERVRKIYKYGMIVTAGFIMGFDGEKKGTGKSIEQCIEDTGICMAMIGLLVALPKTQLTRRLKKEGRMLDYNGVAGSDSGINSRDIESGQLAPDVIDQTLAGLNYVTTRSRIEILEEFIELVANVYSPKSYFARALKTAQAMPYKFPRMQSFWELKRSMKSLVMLSIKMTMNSETRPYFIKNFFVGLSMGLRRFETVMTLSSVYLHFYKQSRYLIKVLNEQVVAQASLPASTEEKTAKLG
ncbi:B12-binding domain-containing radical SAM protein [Oligoflexaceae bacterium]|nr:B12-binding domain-containing radical SAM protein [Oligoflexaceae bacterium]